MRDYKKYEVWTKAHQLVPYMYKEILKDFPSTEKFDLHSQSKRAAYSIPLNIVEGCGRNTDKDFCHFLDIALGSTQELEYSMYLALDLLYITKEKYGTVFRMINDVKAMLINLIKAIRK